MKHRPATFVLLAGDRDWRVVIASASDAGARVVDVKVDDDASPSQVASSVADVLRAGGYAGEPITLAVPSAACFPASISVSGVPTADAKALTYRLEESLPFAAESVVADFIVTGDRALGVCIRPDAFAPVLDALTAAGVDVAVITPAAMLAVQGIRAIDAGMLVFPEPAVPESPLNVVSLQNGRPAQWATVRGTNEDIAAQLKLMRSEPAGTCVTSDVAVEVGGASDIGVTAVDALARGASAIAAGRVRPLLNFRREALAVADPIRRHRRPLNALLATAAIFLLAFTIATFVRAAQYGAAADAAEARLRDEFIAQFPNWSGPINLAVVQSEQRKASSAAAGTANLAARPNALKTLTDVLSRLPAAKGDVTVSRMTFADTSFELEGRVAESDQIDALVTAARGAGLDVTPPQTRRDADNAWSFVLRGTKSGEAAAAVAEGGAR